MEDFEKLLIETTFPINRFRKAVYQKGDTGYRGFCGGFVRLYKRGNIYGISRWMKQPRYATLFEEAKKLCNEKVPDFRFTTVQFNKNYAMAKHLDSYNTAVSYIIGLGDYTGGELLIYYDGENSDPTVVDIKHQFYTFDRSTYYHEVAPFTGNRITLVYFNCLPVDTPDCLINETRQPQGSHRSEWGF